MLIRVAWNMTVKSRTKIALAVSLCSLHMPATLAQDASAASYDPEPFLSAMTTLRAAVSTCDPFVAGGPFAATNSIGVFFESLGQPLPDLTDTETQSSLNRFVASQAALLCKEKIAVAVSAYKVQAGIYMENKPQDWPPSPTVNLAPMCSNENCLEF